NSFRGDRQDLLAARKIFQQLIARYPESALGYLGMSRALLMEAALFDNHYNMKFVHEEALPNAVKALELGPTIRAVHEHYSEIEKIFENYYLNKKEAQIYLTLYPEDPKTFFYAGAFVLDQDEPQKAVEYFSIALDMNPGQELRKKILKYLAWIHLNKYQQYDKAVNYCQQALELEKSSYELNEYLGLAYLRLGDYHASVESLSRALQLSDKSGQAQFYLWLAKGHQAEEEGNVSLAADFFEQALLSRGRDIEVHYKLGNLYFSMADYRKAYDHFRRVIDLQPDKANAYFFAGRSIQSLGDYDSAVTYFSKYLTLATDDQKVAWIKQHMPAVFSRNLLGPGNSF
ncbi:MAG: tetratricopeptide repeat protein, partial [Candidatus Omnitrophota bacterium]